MTAQAETTETVNETEDLSPEDKQAWEAYEKGREEEVEEVKEEPKEEVEAREDVEEAPKQEAEEEPEKPPKGYVPHGALHEERMRRKALEEELVGYREKMARLDERMNLLFTKNEQVPNVDEDPVGYGLHQTKQLESQLTETRKALEDKSKALEEQLQYHSTKSTLESQENRFSQANPDYEQALTYYLKVRTESFQDLGFDDKEAADMANKEAGSIAMEALNRGKNAAEAIYKIAQKSGYKKADAKSSQKTLDTLRKGAEDDRSLKGSGGAVELTAEALAEMSDEEFEKIASSKDFRKVMGG